MTFKEITQEITQKISKIETEWTRIENERKDSFESLSEYIFSVYYKPLSSFVRNNYRSKLQTKDIDNLIQETMSAFLEKNYQLLKNLNRDRGHLRGLFCTIAHHKYVNIINKNNKIKQIDTSELQIEDKNETDMDLCIEIYDSFKKMSVEKGSLYEVFNLFYFENYRVKDISEELNLTEEAIRFRLYTARKWLAKDLKGRI